MWIVETSIELDPLRLCSRVVIGSFCRIPKVSTFLHVSYDYVQSKIQCTAKATTPLKKHKLSTEEQYIAFHSVQNYTVSSVHGLPP
jgi:hypothetical protein